MAASAQWTVDLGVTAMYRFALNGFRCAMRDGKIAYIQGLRALAALSVALYHYPGGAILARRGYAGVDLFFVISGYIMVRVLRRNAGGIRGAAHFLWSRICRIWPAYAAITIATLIVRLAVADLPAVPIGRWLALSLAFYPQWRYGAVIVPGWSLNFEMWFYALLVVALLFGPFRWRAFGLLIMGTLVVLPLAAVGRFAFYGVNYGFGYGAGSELSLITHPIIWNFVIGVGVGLTVDLRIAWRHRPSWFLTIAAISTLLIWMTQSLQLDHGIWWGLPFGALVLVLDLRDKVQPLRIPPPIVWLGDISYSLYLVQFPIVEIISVHHWYRVGPILINGSVAMYLGAVIIAGAASHALLERRASKVVSKAGAEIVRRFRSAGLRQPTPIRSQNLRPSIPNTSPPAP